MLEMRLNCEQCDRDLPLDTDAARICSFECTFCAACSDTLDACCPNCGGPLTVRPSRATALLAKHPASSQARPSLRSLGAAAGAKSRRGRASPRARPVRHQPFGATAASGRAHFY
jgi:hypothetical protein